ncbi:D-amino peptidase [Pilibacter termitis]|uniref:D-amino peptidase n=1 Tax=Pilibacter termitis TaxID=263852 RepID=A0A1T4LV71_9ENTE|nr:M55 family metallopeptidase [Pilibacter termitis]SJZ58531.1 D-amino peptidase [Pilibacter termitis]
MKLYISCDIEGLAGIANFDMEKDDHERFLDLYHAHVQWVIEGIQQSEKNQEITTITISDSHARGVNLSLPRLCEMDERVELISGFPRMDYMMTGLDESYDMVIFLGYHAGIGKKYGSMDHGYSASVAYSLEINGKYMNETTINAAFASELGVPVALIIGESGLKEQLFDEKMFPYVDYVSTKQSLGRYSVKNKPLQQVREEIIAQTKATLAKEVSQLKKYTLTTPLEVKLQCYTTAQADRLEMLSTIDRIDGRSVSFTGESMKNVMNDIVALVGLAGTVH